MPRFVFVCTLIPFLGTALGGGMVFFLKEAMSRPLQQSLAGFAAGVMTAASVWSLLIPAMEQSAFMGLWSFLPAALGFLLGMGAFLLLDRLIPLLLRAEGMGKNTMLTLAVTLHNLPEGMAVGAVCAGWLGDPDSVSATAMLTLAAGVAVQNIPEGAIISLPLRAEGMSRGRAALCGAASGLVEPGGAVLTILLSRWLVPVLPWLLSFAAGAMFFVVLEELVPELRGEEEPALGLTLFALGFALMMTLDVVLK